MAVRRVRVDTPGGTVRATGAASAQSPLDNIPILGLYTRHPAPVRGVCTASSDAGRGAVAGRERWRCGAGFPPRRSKPLVSGAPRRAPKGPFDGACPASSQRMTAPRPRPSNGGVLRPRKGVQRDERSTTEKQAEQTSNIARGTPGTWRTCGCFTSTSLDVARRRGPWVRWALWRSARPLLLRGAPVQTTACPGPVKNAGDDARLLSSATRTRR